MTTRSLGCTTWRLPTSEDVWYHQRITGGGTLIPRRHLNSRLTPAWTSVRWGDCVRDCNTVTQPICVKDDRLRSKFITLHVFLTVKTNVTMSAKSLRNPLNRFLSSTRHTYSDSPAVPAFLILSSDILLCSL